MKLRIGLEVSLKKFMELEIFQKACVKLTETMESAITVEHSINMEPIMIVELSKIFNIW